MSDFDFSDQLDAMTISAVFKVIWEIRGALFQGKNKELKEQFRACIESPQIRRDAPYCPVSYTHLDVYKRQGTGCGL